LISRDLGEGKRDCGEFENKKRGAQNEGRRVSFKNQLKKEGLHITASLSKVSRKMEGEDTGKDSGKGQHID